MLANAANGKAFIIQSGDCAERFTEANNLTTKQKYDHLTSMKQLVEKITSLPAILIGRIAGQYGKPTLICH